MVGRVHSDRIGLSSVKVIQLWFYQTLPQENMSLKPPWKNLSELMLCMDCGRNSKNIVKFLQAPLGGLRHEQEDGHKRNDVKSSIETKTPSRGQSQQHTWECESKNRSPEVIGCNSPRHSYFSVRQRKYLSRINKSTRTFSGRVESNKGEDEEGNHAKLSWRRGGNKERHAGAEKSKEHKRECRDKESAPSPGIDRFEGGERKDEHGLPPG